MSTAQTPQAGRSDKSSLGTVADTELQGGAIGLPAILMQAITHIAMLAISCAALPIFPNPFWKTANRIAASGVRPGLPLAGTPPSRRAVRSTIPRRTGRAGRKNR